MTEASRTTTPEPFREELEETRQRFLDHLGDLRPQLHRYCSRMMGSHLDGEDIVQEALATAYFKITMLRDGEDLKPWLFRIAHNRCIDELRRRKYQEVDLEDWPEPSTRTRDHVSRQQEVKGALAIFVTTLPPMERACVVLKDVMGYRLNEIAEIVGSTVGGVKSALHRAREKLKKRQETPTEKPSEAPEAPVLRRLLEAYAERFNARDWDGVLSLLRADARLEVVDIYDGEGHPAFTTRYFKNYSAFSFAWRYEVGTVEGELVIKVFAQNDDGSWRPFSVIRFIAVDGGIYRVRDYIHVPPYFIEEIAAAWF